VYFQYGTSTAYGGQTAAGPLSAGLSDITGLIAAAPALPMSLSAALTGLAPGTLYHFRLVASNPDGTAYGSDQTFTTGSVAQPPAAPVLGRLAISPSRLRAQGGRGASTSAARARRGATISYTDSQAATATFTVQRPRRGYRVGRSCDLRRPRTSRSRLKRCTRYVNLGTFTHDDTGGRARLHFTGRVKGRPLAPGRYRLALSARNPARLRSRTLTVGFSVIR
jgi:hypothetical protein